MVCYDTSQLGPSLVSMKSGLGDRNNGVSPLPALPDDPVSMKSGLGDRNNAAFGAEAAEDEKVSMKSGLGDRNNRGLGASGRSSELGLNEVRSWRPEQSGTGSQWEVIGAGSQ